MSEIHMGTTVTAQSVGRYDEAADLLGVSFTKDDGEVIHLNLSRETAQFLLGGLHDALSGMKPTGALMESGWSEQARAAFSKWAATGSVDISVAPQLGKINESLCRAFSHAPQFAQPIDSAAVRELLAAAPKPQRQGPIGTVTIAHEGIAEAATLQVDNIIITRKIEGHEWLLVTAEAQKDIPLTVEILLSSDEVIGGEGDAPCPDRTQTAAADVTSMPPPDSPPFPEQGDAEQRLHALELRVQCLEQSRLAPPGMRLEWCL